MIHKAIWLIYLGLLLSITAFINLQNMHTDIIKVIITNYIHNFISNIEDLFVS